SNLKIIDEICDKSYDGLDFHGFGCHYESSCNYLVEAMERNKNAKYFDFCFNNVRNLNTFLKILQGTPERQLDKVRKITIKDGECSSEEPQIRNIKSLDFWKQDF